MLFTGLIDMQILKLSINSHEYGLMISEAMYEMGFPSYLRNPDIVTKYFAPVIQHPVSLETALVLPTEELYIHPDRNVNPLLGVILAPLPEEIAAIVQNHFDNFDWENTPKTINNLLPSIYHENLISHEQAIADGWFDIDF
jgi:hypothetical protein